jgi:hypothetical protein
MSLGEAITEFANDYDTTAATSPDCEEAPAYF